MCRCILRWLAPLLLIASCCISTANAQAPNRPRRTREEAERSPPALQYAVAVASSLAILTIICYPSRKR
jgi:hypothetical protein